MFTLDKQPSVAQKLKENGVAKIKFYYSEKDPVVNNCFTVCLLLSGTGKLLSRGVSICSVKDMHNKSDARDKSFGRALKALIKKEASEQINPRRFIETYEGQISDLFIVRKNGVRIPLDYPLREAVKYFSYKSEFEPTPTEKEVRIITSKKKE